MPVGYPTGIRQLRVKTISDRRRHRRRRRISRPN
jgi:hypothetical protein